MIFHPSETTAVESRSRNVWMEWNEGESLCRATRLNDISLPPTAPPEKDITSKKIFFVESTSCRLQTRRREREWEGGEKVFLRHVALICSPAANENDDLQKVFFSSSLLALNLHCKTHSWRHTLNKCNLYSMMNITKKADRTRPSSHTDFTDKTAAFVLNMWSVAHAASANLSPELGAKVWLLRTT